MTMNSKNPYCGKPGYGLFLPPYLNPTKYVSNSNFYYHGAKDLDYDEIRISFVGGTP
jgi:hypothetical protein